MANKSLKTMLVMSFQARVGQWTDACFGKDAEENKAINRNHRFLEEAAELVQALDCTEDEAIAVIRYVFSRPRGEPQQEMGGVLTTLAALANTHHINMKKCAETELARIWTVIDKVRAKQAAKPIFGHEPQ